MNPEPLTLEEAAARLGASLARLKAELARAFAGVRWLGPMMLIHAQHQDARAVALDRHADDLRVWAQWTRRTGDYDG